MYFFVEENPLQANRENTLSGEKLKIKKEKRERKRGLKLPRSEEGSGNPQLKNWKASATTAEKQPSQGHQLLLPNTKRPENRGSRQIFCPTQPVRAKFFRHVSEL